MQCAMLASVLSLALLNSCGGGSTGGSDASGSGSSSSGGGGNSSSYTVGGTITGLGAATGLVLANMLPNGSTDTLTVPADATSFTMPTAVPSASAYDVTVKAHPVAVQCNVISGAGTTDGANVTTINVSCAPGSEAVLYSFVGAPEDGNVPTTLIQASDGNLYGVTDQGGTASSPSYGCGIVFKATPNGTITPSDTETVLHSFAGGTTDGCTPSGLIQASDGNFYGVASGGGANNDGVVFKITPSGTESILYAFAGGADGAGPNSLIQASDGNFYGLTYYGGSSNDGVLFKITPTGTESVLYSFAGGAPGISLIQGDDGNFYATTFYGGTSGECGNPSVNPYPTAGNGVVFRLTANGTETVLHSFAGGTTDGCQPGGLIQASDGNFYGVTLGGGANNAGVVFKITPTGIESVLYSFSGGTTDGTYGGKLIQASDGNLYGITVRGGIVANPCDYLNGNGVLFKITLTGTETVLHAFAGGSTEGCLPDSLIQASDGTLYGATLGGGAGGANNDGTIWQFN